MNATGLLQFLPYFVAPVIPLFLGISTMFMNRGRAGRTFEALLFQHVLWMLSVLFELISADLEGKIFWDNFQFFIAGSVAVTTLSFALRYEGLWFKYGWKTYSLALAYPILIWLFAFTDRFHHLLRPDIRLAPGPLYGELLYTFTVPVLFLLMPFYLMAMTGIYRLGLLALRKRGSTRIGAVLACFGFLLPLMGTVLTILGVRFSLYLDMSSIWLVAGDAVIALALYRFRMANIMPSARTSVFLSLKDPVLVIDQEGLILESNVPLNSIPHVHCDGSPSQHAMQCFSAWPEAARLVFSGVTDEAEVSFDSPARMTFHLKSFALKKGSIFRIVVIRNISTLRHAEEELRTLTANLEDKVLERTLSLEREIELRKETENVLRELNAEIGKTQKEIMITLSEVVENRFQETVFHVTRVAEYARTIALAVGLSPAEAEILANASSMHDIGKIGIPDSVLSKNGPLDAEETALIQTHTTIGYEILRNSRQEFIQAASQIALEHHERWDGGGYPGGLRGGDISLFGRIVAVCDVFDSMASARSYRQGWALPDILRFFEEEKGRMFDPVLVETLFSEMSALMAICIRYPDIQKDGPE